MTQVKKQFIDELVRARQEASQWELVDANRKEGEEALRESEERFRQFFQTNANYCYMVSRDGVNPGVWMDPRARFKDA